MDGVDVALIETDGDRVSDFGPTFGFPYDANERALLREAMTSARGMTKRGDRDGVLGIAESMITAKHQTAVERFAEIHKIALPEIDVIGFHGQTVVHRPDKGFTVQLGDGVALSNALQVPVVYDFRHEDMMQSGQGAPLVPIFHRALALQAGLPLPAAFVNIGGISNVTYIPDGPADSLVAFDAGPGNCLLDDWAMRYTGQPLDRDGKLALSGQVDRAALSQLISHPFFSSLPPKSLDRGSFSIDSIAGLSPGDGAATLTAFTVAGLGMAGRLFPEAPKVWIVSGGGARNPHMVEGLRRVLNAPLMTAEEAGFNTDFMEAQAFAYLATRHLMGLPCSFPGTTGASKPVIGGVLVGERRGRSSVDATAFNA